MKDPKERLEFSCFDDFNNDGWGNPDREPREEEEECIYDENESDESRED